MKRLSLAAVLIILSFSIIASPVEGSVSIIPDTVASTEWSVNIWFTPSCSAATPQITSVFPDSSFCVFANISASTTGKDLGSLTGDTTPMAKINLPDGVVIEKPWSWDVSQGGGSLYTKYEYEVHFYALEDGTPSWYDSFDGSCGQNGYCTPDNLPDNTNWTTNWSVRIEEGVLPKNQTVHIAMYDAPSATWDDTNEDWYQWDIPLYGGYGNKFFQDIRPDRQDKRDSLPIG
jgi:hypothetical protein